ncbi:hypothetical protein ACMX2H_15855 [Arthrobacter sulfonylureivorans]|uniref:hypothetical protein n=1 Tax=Arthrobacter sulfonylureivorans TaxID=2486855 RepID=UPI0039E5E952
MHTFTTQLTPAEAAGADELADKLADLISGLVATSVKDHKLTLTTTEELTKEQRDNVFLCLVSFN